MATADITTLQVKQKDVDLVEGGALFSMSTSQSWSATQADDGEFVLVFTLPADIRIIDAILTHDATLGASCVLALYHNDGTTRTALTGDTTAGGASTVRMSAAAMDVDAGDTIEIECEGADVSAAANVITDVIAYRR